MRNEWRADLPLKLEDLVDKFVLEGIDREEIMKGIGEEIKTLRKPYDHDPDPADDGYFINKPANDRPGAS
jgi:hypothetical protein